ncbi:DJ-1/PfpI family protein [Paenibacillus hodogayensis]|uniref:DJ-1/PfpI family protein n=1 Tax=Paenibacillus hodogayensis TaxID=279208 RepID=A0ABV5W4P1_9BACL
MKKNQEKVAFLLADGYEDSEMKNPYEAITRNGNAAVIIGLEKEAELRGKKGTIAYTTHLSIDEANPDDYRAVVIPGGQSPEKLMENEAVLDFLRDANEKGITISAICHGPLLLSKAGLAQGRHFTSYAGVAEEIAKEGGVYSDKPVVVDDNLITSRGPDDESYFIEETIRKLGVSAY